MIVPNRRGPVGITLARDLRPRPKHIAKPGTRPFYLEHSGELVIQAVMWDVKLRELYDLVRGGRYDSRILFRILEGAALYATAGYALDTEDFPAGVALALENRGRVQGKGGDGAPGSPWGSSSNPDRDGADGGAGGNAILVQHDIDIDNTSGEIFSGGGGGGSGSGIEGAAYAPAASGAGGGGAGTVPGNGGAWGDGGVPAPENGGEPGTADAGGLSGVGSDGYLQSGGDGGNGGDPGEAGQPGTAAVNNTGGGTVGTPGAGGAAGNAIVQSGGTVTFTGGNNSTQIKGGIV